MGCTFRSGENVERAIVSLSSGEDVFYHIRALRQCYPESKIIVTVANLDSASRHILDATNAGADEVLEKTLKEIFEEN